MLLTIAERFRDALVPFLIAGTSLLLFLLVLLIAQRLFRAAAESRRDALTERYRTVIDSAMATESPLALDAVGAIPGRHRRIAADLVLSRVRIVRGSTNERALAIADRLGLTGGWRDDLISRFW